MQAPTPTELDKAILAYRNDPTELNRERLIRLQRERATGFYKANANEYIGRTK